MIYSLSLVICLYLIIPVQTCSADEPKKSSDEYALKAVCLYNFTQFTRWPGAKDLDKSDSIIVGIVGSTHLNAALEGLQTWIKKTNKKKITLVYHGTYHEGMDLRGNHLLFISTSEKKHMESILAGLGDAPVLTVSDTNGFLEAGGMISLVILNNKVRWGINQTAIKRSGLHVSAKLLQLAIRIESQQEQSDLLQYEHIREIPWPSLQEALASLP